MTDTTPPAGGPAEQPDSGPGSGTEPASGPGQTGREWLGQLQAMIDDLATQAAPTVRQVGAKAAELAAVAADKAGPLAHRAADATQTASVKLAERSRHIAEDLRRDQGTEAGAAEPESQLAPPTEPGGTPSAAEEPRAPDDEEDGA